MRWPLRLLCRVMLIVTLVSCHSARWSDRNTAEEDSAFQRRLQNRDPEAMYQMGFFYFAKPGLVRYSNGQPVRQEDRNYGGALTWFTRAAEAGHVEAMIQTANLYSQGMGRVPQDLSAAVYWYSRAFERGERNYSPFWLGEYHMRGVGGLRQDFTKAFYFFNNSYGPYPLESLLARTETSTDEIPIKTRFAIYGASALRRISLFYRCGWSVQVDVAKADRIISQCAAYLDNPWCQRDLQRGAPRCQVPSADEKLDD